jgi:hypothetical protein
MKWNEQFVILMKYSIQKASSSDAYVYLTLPPLEAFLLISFMTEGMN